ncbi:MAG: DUF4296 domain-containing protein [Bacteroidales bacterium]|nr:DUF4296 domain-containing protein [Bacteroidales bacterium]
MKRIVFIALLFVLVTACGHKDKGFVPERLLSEKEMIDIMSDVQIIEADINYHKTQEKEAEAHPKDYRKLTQSYYDQLFEHYGITDSIFSQNMRYYTERPALLEKIMDSVMQRFVREQS